MNQLSQLFLAIFSALFAICGAIASLTGHWNVSTMCFAFALICKSAELMAFKASFKLVRA